MATVTREKAFRGISVRLAVHYLENLGGEAVEPVETGDTEGTVEADGWRATLTSEKVGVGPTVSLTEVRIVFEGEAATLDPLVDDFSQKAMRAGG
jgi:hypothetical protein